MADENFGNLLDATNQMTPADNVFLITPNDGADLAIHARGISFAGAGALKITDEAGNAVVIPSGALAAGIIHPVRAARVWATGTTATGICGFA